MYQLPRQLAEIIKPMVQNEMQQTKELEARRVNASKNYASSMTRNHEVSNQVINLDSLYLNGPIQVGPTPLVQPNIAFFP